MAISELSKSVKLQQSLASNKCQYLFLCPNLYLTERQVHQPAAADGAYARKGLLFHLPWRGRAAPCHHRWIAVHIFC